MVGRLKGRNKHFHVQKKPNIKEMKMNTMSGTKKSGLIFIAVIVCLMLAPSISAQVGSNGATLRVMDQGETHTGFCCSVWSDFIQMTQPEKPVPMIVTWSTDYRSNAPLLVGLRLNGGPCTFYGPAYLPASAPGDDTYASKTIQWVIMPGDYNLLRGANSIRLCGGGIFSQDDSITLGFYTFHVTLGK
jgi:hypothetical protein